MSSRLTSLKKSVRGLSLVGILAATSMYSCAATTSTSQEPKVEIPVAAVQKESGKLEPLVLEQETPEQYNPVQVARAALKVAKNHVNRGHIEAAAKAYRIALNTGALNGVGSAVAYWNIARSENKLNDTDAMCEDLASFVSYAEAIFERETDVVHIVDGDNFVESFKLADKLDRARAMLSCEWSRKVEDFGRSEDYAIPIRNQNELMVFFEYMHECEFSAIEQTPIGEESNIEHVVYQCTDDDFSTEFYFEFLR